MQQQFIFNFEDLQVELSKEWGTGEDSSALGMWWEKGDSFLKGVL